MTPPTGTDTRPLLNIRCKSVKCEDGLHCFLDPPSPRQLAALISDMNLADTSPLYPPFFDQPGNARTQTRGCWSCGAELIDWNRLHSRRLADVDYTVASLNLETIRHFFWNTEIDQHAKNHALRKGMIGLVAAIERRLLSSLNSDWDGQQTATSGNIIYYAQHATATCCRKCLAVWHGLPETHTLSQADYKYLRELIAHYVRIRFPIPDEGQRVPPIRNPNRRRTRK